MWECGGTLAAPAIAGGAIHKTMAFVAPKLVSLAGFEAWRGGEALGVELACWGTQSPLDALTEMLLHTRPCTALPSHPQIGGSRAPTPVGDLGFVEMTQALQLAEVQWQQCGPDLMLTGYMPQSGGLRALAAAAAAADAGQESGSSGSSSLTAAVALPAGATSSGTADPAASGGSARHPGARLESPGVAEFYKAWDRYGCLSNFSPHPISMPAGAMTAERLQQQQAASSSSQQQGQQQPAASGSQQQQQQQAWASTEHYYQAQKFAGVSHPDAAALVQAIAAAASPEEAARLGRRAQRQRPELVRPDWEASKVAAMLGALRAKFGAHPGPRRMLLATARNCGGRGCDGSGGRVGPPSAVDERALAAGGLELVESSPHDFFWGRGYDGSGANMLGKLLMKVREELQQQQGGGGSTATAATAAAAGEAQQQRQAGGSSAPGRRPAGV